MNDEACKLRALPESRISNTSFHFANSTCVCFVPCQLRTAVDPHLSCMTIHGGYSDPWVIVDVSYKITRTVVRLCWSMSSSPCDSCPCSDWSNSRGPCTGCNRGLSFQRNSCCVSAEEGRTRTTFGIRRWWIRRWSRRPNWRRARCCRECHIMMAPRAVARTQQLSFCKSSAGSSIGLHSGYSMTGKQSFQQHSANQRR